jgi:hypothetical protein
VHEIIETDVRTIRGCTARYPSTRHVAGLRRNSLQRSFPFDCCDSFSMNLRSDGASTRVKFVSLVEITMSVSCCFRIITASRGGGPRRK